MAALGRLVVTLSANIAEFTDRMDKASFIADQRSRAIARSIDKAVSLAGRGLTAAATLITAAVKKSLDNAGELADLSESIGMNVESFQGLAYAAAQSGVSAEDFRNAMVKLAQAVADNDPAFAAMGISLRDANGNLKSTEEVVFAVANKMRGYRDGMEETALSTELFGKAGSKLVPVLNQGAEKLRDFIDKAREAGVILSEETIKQADEFGDKLDFIKLQALAAAGNFTNGLIPSLYEVGRAFSTGAGAAADWKQAGESVGQFVRQTIAGLVLVTGVLESSLVKIEGYRKAWSLIFKGSFKEAQNAVDEANEQSLLSMGKAFDRAGVLLRSGTAYTIAEAKRAAEEAARIADDAKRPKGGGDPPNTKAFQEAQRAAAERANELASIIKKVDDAYQELIFTQDEIIIQNARLAGASDEVIADLEAKMLATQLLRNQQELEKETNQALNDTLKDQKALVDSLPDMYYNVASSSEKYRIDLEKILDLEKALIVAGAKLADIQQWKAAAMEDLAEKYKPAAEGARDFAQAIATAFEDAIVSGKSLGDVLKALADDILRIIIRITVTKPLEKALTDLLSNSGSISSGGGGGGFWSSLFRGLIGGFLGGGFGGAAGASAGGAASAIPWVSPQNITGLASGGDVLKGRTYLVGERGPELFTAVTNGHILNNTELLKMLAVQPAKEMSKLATVMESLATQTPKEPSGTRRSLASEFVETLSQVRKTADGLARPSPVQMMIEMFRSGLTGQPKADPKPVPQAMSMMLETTRALVNRIISGEFGKSSAPDSPIMAIVKQAVESVMGRQRIAPSGLGPNTVGQIGDVARAAIAEITNRQQPATAASTAPVRSTRQVFNITTPNADSFRLSQRQIARRARGFVTA